MTNGKITHTARPSYNDDIKKLSEWVVQKVSVDVMFHLAEMKDEKSVKVIVTKVANGLYEGFYGLDECFTRQLYRLPCRRITSRVRRAEVRIAGIRDALMLAIDRHRGSDDWSDAALQVVVQRESVMA